ncbi:hypothetical protein LR48_Vigan662s000100 [Vigna angularis]|uniref:Uncharacterized protein n=1 Tax=Phaseolus angularis TaxID=3914 RepID=A0A0L9TGY6_PHAAN|nr:hypothetical protein LR48_Vigan662s000100 [Vigna angularis]
MSCPSCSPFAVVIFFSLIFHFFTVILFSRFKVVVVVPGGVVDSSRGGRKLVVLRKKAAKPLRPRVLPNIAALPRERRDHSDGEETQREVQREREGGESERWSTKTMEREMELRELLHLTGNEGGGEHFLGGKEEFVEVQEASLPSLFPPFVIHSLSLHISFILTPPPSYFILTLEPLSFHLPSFDFQWCCASSLMCTRNAGGAGGRLPLLLSSSRCAQGLEFILTRSVYVHRGESSSQGERTRPMPSARRVCREENNVDIVEEQFIIEEYEDYVEHDDVEYDDVAQQQHAEGEFRGSPHGTSLLTYYTKHVAFALWQG